MNSTERRLAEFDFRDILSSKKEADRMDQVKIGRFIAERRKEREYTQRQLADLLGISFGILQRTFSKKIKKSVLSYVPLLLSVAGILRSDLDINLDIEGKLEQNTKICYNNSELSFCLEGGDQ